MKQLSTLLKSVEASTLADIVVGVISDVKANKHSATEPISGLFTVGDIQAMPDTQLYSDEVLMDLLGAADGRLCRMICDRCGVHPMTLLANPKLFTITSKLYPKAMQIIRKRKQTASSN